MLLPNKRTERNRKEEFEKKEMKMKRCIQKDFTCPKK